MKIFMLLIVLFTIIKAEVSVNNEVKNFVSKGSNKEIRSSLGSHKKSSVSVNLNLASEFTDEETGEEPWRTNKGFYYLIDYSKSEKGASKLTPKFKKIGLSKNSFFSNVMFFETEEINNEIKSSLMRGTINTLSEEELTSIANKKVSTLFPMFKNKIEFQNTEIEFVNDQINKLTVRYRRIFNKGIVLQNISYISLTVDGLGEVIASEIKWPKFKKINNEKKGIFIEEAFSQVSTKYAVIASRETNEFTGDPGVNKLTITGAAFGWKCDNIKEYGKVLIPSYAFIGTAETEDGKIEKYYLEVNKF